MSWFIIGLVRSGCVFKGAPVKQRNVLGRSGRWHAQSSSYRSDKRECQFKIAVNVGIIMLNGKS